MSPYLIKSMMYVALTLVGNLNERTYEMAFLKDIRRNPVYKKQLNSLLPDAQADKLDVVDFDVQPSEEQDELDPETRPSSPTGMAGGDGEDVMGQSADLKVRKKRRQVSDVLNSLKGTE